MRQDTEDDLMIRITIHAARRCPCGAGLDLPLSDASGGGSVRLVAERAPAIALALASPEDLDRLEIPGVALRPVRCHICGASGPATHSVIAADGTPVGADTVAGLLEYGRRERARERSVASALGPVGPVPDALPEDAG